MFKTERIAVALFLLSLGFILVSNTFVKFYDEIATIAMISIAIFDSSKNKQWRRYTGLWIILFIMSFYAIYSISIAHFNTLKYILMDALIESKPYVAFFTFLGIAPTLYPKDKLRIKYIALTLSIITVIPLILGMAITKLFFGHPFIAGSIMFLSAMCYWLSNTNADGETSRHDKIIILLILCGGLLCTRSKYYGCFVLAVFFLFVYKPGILTHVKLSHALIVCSLCCIFIAVAWKKISFYFITGASDTVDLNSVASMARAALLLTTPLIMIDYFPFGSGLASYGTYPAYANYSLLHYEYGLDKIWGLSPDMPEFIMDLFFASLAQYGIAGIILFIYFWVYAYRYLKFLLRQDAAKYKNTFSIGSLIICFVLIECVGGNTFVQPSGQVAMMLLGIICGQGKRLMHQADTVHGAPQEKQDNSPHLPEKTIRHKI